MNILAIDQARNGAWCVYDYESKTVVKYGVFSFPTAKYTYAQMLVGICDIVNSIVDEFEVAAVFIEDIQMRKNVDSFKKLAQLQGALVSMFERNEYLYDFIPPSRWQSYCNARGRTSKEIKQKVQEIQSDKKQSKILSIQFAKEVLGIETDDDNLADAICIGYYIVNNIVIRTSEERN